MQPQLTDANKLPAKAAKWFVKTNTAKVIHKYVTYILYIVSVLCLSQFLFVCFKVFIRTITVCTALCCFKCAI